MADEESIVSKLLGDPKLKAAMKGAVDKFVAAVGAQTQAINETVNSFNAPFADAIKSVEAISPKVSQVTQALDQLFDSITTEAATFELPVVDTVAADGISATLQQSTQLSVDAVTDTLESWAQSVNIALPDTVDLDTTSISQNINSSIVEPINQQFAQLTDQVSALTGTVDIEGATAAAQSLSMSFEQLASIELPTIDVTNFSQQTDAVQLAIDQFTTDPIQQNLQQLVATAQQQFADIEVPEINLEPLQQNIEQLEQQVNSFDPSTAIQTVEQLSAQLTQLSFDDIPIQTINQFAQGISQFADLKAPQLPDLTQFNDDVFNLDQTLEQTNLSSLSSALDQLNVQITDVGTVEIAPIDFSSIADQFTADLSQATDGVSQQLNDQVTNMDIALEDPDVTPINQMISDVIANLQNIDPTALQQLGDRFVQIQAQVDQLPQINFNADSFIASVQGAEQSLQSTGVAVDSLQQAADTLAEKMTTVATGLQPQPEIVANPTISPLAAEDLPPPMAAMGQQGSVIAQLDPQQMANMSNNDDVVGAINNSSATMTGTVLSAVEMIAQAIIRNTDGKMEAMAQAIGKIVQQNTPPPQVSNNQGANTNRNTSTLEASKATAVNYASGQ